MEIYERYPYFAVHYENAGYATVPNGCSIDTTVTTDGGETHYLHYADGWWYDRNTGIGFPARMVPLPQNQETN